MSHLSSWYFRRQSEAADEEAGLHHGYYSIYKQHHRTGSDSSESARPISELPPLPPMPALPALPPVTPLTLTPAKKASMASISSATHLRQESKESLPSTYKSSEYRSSWAETIIDVTAWERFKGKGKKEIGWLDSLKAIFFHSWLNTWLIFVPIAWAVHFTNVGQSVKFAFAFLAIIPLNKLLEFGGEQMSLYVGKVLGDLIIITLNNFVEGVLAIILLFRCDLRLLQSTIIGVVLLHLLLVPGTTFLVGGARILEQNLDRHFTQMNHTLLTIGVLALLLPTSFFAALNKVSVSQPDTQAELIYFDVTRNSLLKISRGLAVILLVVYICSRIFLHAPPGKDKAADSLKEFEEKERELQEEDPQLNTWVTIIMLLVLIGLLTPTVEFLVDSVEHVREEFTIEAEWFGLFLLPLVSFSGDAVLAIVYYIRYLAKSYLGTPTPPTTMAETRSIDSSVQFIIFWMPLLIILGWFSGKPMSMLFDLFELAILLGACFLVNYVTADSKTNWEEGLILVAFYLMIAVAAWFYPGQLEVAEMVSCKNFQLSLVSISDNTLL